MRGTSRAARWLGRRTETFLLGAQWVAIMAPASLSLAIVTSAVLGLPATEGTTLVARSLFFTAAFTAAQIGIGHRLAAFEGPASVTLAALILSLDSGAPTPDPVGAMAGGLLVSAGIVLLLGLSGLLWVVSRYYTPFVSGVFLLLLAATVSWALVPEAVNEPGPGGSLVYPIAFVLVVAISLILELRGHGAWRTLSVLVSFVAGSAVFLVAGELSGPIPGGGAISFRLVRPTFDPAIAVPVGASAVLVAVNALATMGLVSAAARRPVGHGTLRRGSAVTALSHAVQGLLPGVASVPRAESASLVARSPSLARASLLLGCGLLAALAVTPPAVEFLLRLPAALASDVLLGIMGSLAVLGVRELWSLGRATRWPPSRWAVFAAALAFGGFLVPGPPGWLPDSLKYVAASPLFVGVAIALTGEVWLARRG